jgi:hypothetical protein
MVSKQLKIIIIMSLFLLMISFVNGAKYECSYYDYSMCFYGMCPYEEKTCAPDATNPVDAEKKCELANPDYDCFDCEEVTCFEGGEWDWWFLSHRNSCCLYLDCISYKPGQTGNCNSKIDGSDSWNDCFYGHCEYVGVTRYTECSKGTRDNYCADNYCCENSCGGRNDKCDASKGLTCPGYVPFGDAKCVCSDPSKIQVGSGSDATCCTPCSINSNICSSDPACLVPLPDVPEIPPPPASCDSCSGAPNYYDPDCSDCTFGTTCSGLGLCCGSNLCSPGQYCCDGTCQNDACAIPITNIDCERCSANFDCTFVTWRMEMPQNIIDMRSPDTSDNGYYCNEYTSTYWSEASLYLKDRQHSYDTTCTNLCSGGDICSAFGSCTSSSACGECTTPPEDYACGLSYDPVPIPDPSDPSGCSSSECGDSCNSGSDPNPVQTCSDPGTQLSSVTVTVTESQNCYYDNNLHCTGCTTCDYDCNPYNCNPHDCNPYDCNCETCYDTCGVIPNTYNCNPHPCNCDTCYQTCYDTCYDTCYFTGTPSSTSVSCSSGSCTSSCTGSTCDTNGGHCTNSNSDSNSQQDQCYQSCYVDNYCSGNQPRITVRQDPDASATYCCAGNTWLSGGGCCGDDGGPTDTFCGSNSACEGGLPIYDGDYSSYACNCIEGSGRWAVGGNTAQTTCCGDDANENYNTQVKTSDAPALFSGSSDACCTSSSSCVLSSTCYNSGSTEYAIPNKGYCAGGIWQGGDDSSTACTAIVGSGYWWQGGETDPTTCCGDDLNEYKNNPIEGINIFWSDDDPACCTTKTDCTRNDGCYDVSNSYSNLNPGSNDNIAYCEFNTPDSFGGIWRDCDDSDSVCSNCGLDYLRSGQSSGVGEYPLGIYLYDCCGDDVNEYTKTCINATNNDQTGCNPSSSFQTVCCDESTDCVDKNGVCRDSNPFVAYSDDIFGGYYCYNGRWMNPDSGSCGDGICSNGEDCSSCSSDCGTCSSTCNDGICRAGELCDCPGGNDCNNYPDCILTDTCSNKGTCGDGICSYYETFTQYYCELDCFEDSTQGDDGKSYNVGGEIANGWCGNKGIEFYRYCEGSHDSKASCSLSCSATDNNFDACCDNFGDCVDQNGDCQTSGRCYEHFGYSFCDAGRWHDPDESIFYCMGGSDGGFACQIDSNLVLNPNEDYTDFTLGNMNKAYWLVSDIDDNGVGSCCGDDYNENFLSSKGKHNDSSWACCDNPTDCVWGSECFEIGERNNDNTLICGVNREWDNAEEWYVEQTHDDFPVLIQDEVQINSIHPQRYVSCNSPFINRNQEWKLPGECKGDVTIKFIDKFDNPISGVFIELHAYDDYYRYDGDNSYESYSGVNGIATFTGIDASYYYAIIPPVEGYSLVPFVLEVSPKTRVNYSSLSNWGTVRLTDLVKCSPDCVNIEYGVCSAECEGVNGCEFEERENSETFEFISGQMVKDTCDGYAPGVRVAVSGTNSDLLCCGSEYENRMNEFSIRSRPDSSKSNVECDGGDLVLLRKLVNFRGRPINMVVAVCK